MPTKNPRKNLKKPSAAPGNFEKPSKNHPRSHFYEFWLLNATKGGARGLARAPPLSLRISHSQNPQKCLRGGFFEGFRGPREGFLRVFQNFRGRRRVFLRFFEGFLLALESLCLAVSASSFFPRFSVFLIFFDLIFFKFYFFGHFSIFRHRKIIKKSLFRQKRPF